MRIASWRPAVVAIVAVMVAACTSETTQERSPAEALELAAARTRETGSSKFHVSIQAGSVRMSGDGAFDYDSRKGHMIMELPDPSGTSVALSTESVFDGSVVYMKMPQMAQAAPGGKPWFRLDLSQAGKLAGLDLSGFGRVEQSDPVQYLAYLRAVSGDAAEVGTGEVRGVSTTRYAGTVDLERVVDEAPPGSKERVRTVVKQLRTLLQDEPMTLEVWIDDEGLARRIRSDFVIKEPTSGERVGITTTFELFDFGTEVAVEIPSEDQVTDMTEFLRPQGE